MDNLLNSLSELISQNTYFAPFIAFLAGVLTSFTPCSLSTVPLIISVVSGTGEKNTKRAFLMSLTFAIGSAITFTIFGVIASLAGSLIGSNSKIFYLILGVLMMLLTLQTWGIYNIIPSTYLVSKNKKRGYIGAFLAGILGGIFSSPCSTPVLIALIALVSVGSNLGYGILLFLMYSLGHGFLAIISGTSVGFVKKLSSSEKYGAVSKGLNIILGVFIMFIGFYMFYLGF